MKKYVFLLAGIICFKTMPMEQPSDSSQLLEWREGEIPSQDTVPDFMKYKAHCTECDASYEGISLAMLRYRFKKCHHPFIMNQQPLYYYCVIFQCPECQKTATCTAQYDNIIGKVNVFANKHKHNKPFPFKGRELYRKIIKTWKYVSEKPERKKKIKDSENMESCKTSEEDIAAKYLYLIKYPHKRKRE
jgi:hypothetical protein